MIRPKNETEELLFSVTENCEPLIKKLIGETLEFKLTQPRETFSIQPPISVGGCWVV